VTKIGASFVGRFAQVGGNLGSPEQPVQSVLRIANVRGSGEVYGRFMGGSSRNMSNSGHLAQSVQFMQFAQCRINTGDCASR
jgi:hypothetical protein